MDLTKYADEELAKMVYKNERTIANLIRRIEKLEAIILEGKSGMP